MSTPPGTPNPQRLDEVLTSKGVDHQKRYKCRRYSKCLDVACEAGWQQFHCRDCTAYVPMDDSDPEHKVFARLGVRKEFVRLTMRLKKRKP